jgi:hemocyanin-like protein
MATPQERAESFLKRPIDRKPLPVTNKEAKGVVTLGAGDAAPAEFPFSTFIDEHEKAGLRVASEMMHIANANPGEAGLQKVLELAEQEAQRSSIDLVKYALLVFITHHPTGRLLPSPSLEERDPAQVKPSHPPLGTITAGVVTLGATGDEKKLDWYREDPTTSDHHFRWHVVYPRAGSPDPNDPDVLVMKDRQGELFLYMHQQMLARYDTERLGAGLQVAASLNDYGAKIPEGYDPNIQGLTSRAPNQKMSGTANITDWTKAIVTELRNGAGDFNVASRPVPDVIGCTIEQNDGSRNLQKYGGLHNSGHGIIASIRDPQGNPGRGAMAFTDTAIRDPVFYRWHRQIDDIFAVEWQEKQAIQSFADAPANISMRDVLSGVQKIGVSPDIILCREDKVTGDPAAFGEAKFGGAKFDTDAAASGVTTDVLETKMVLRDIDVDGDMQQVEVLDHDDFYYFLRIRNDNAAARKVTVRIFLAAEAFMEQRRRWIELDKFQVELAASSKTVVERSSRQAAVVRKPARRPDEPQPPLDPGDDRNWCDCGWPYHLLLPRGKQAGMKFRLLVVLTDWDKDKVEADAHCGSTSYCGKRDAKYPDLRPMGYPFDRKWPGAIAATVLAQKNMAARDITIRFT